MAQNNFAELKSEYAFLSRVEKSVADRILSNPEMFINYSIACFGHPLRI